MKCVHNHIAGTHRLIITPFCARARTKCVHNHIPYLGTHRLFITPFCARAQALVLGHQV